MRSGELDILIDKVKSGDSSSFEPIVDQYKNLVFSVCIKIVDDQELAEEVAQDTFLKAFQKLNTFKGNSKFSTWLYRIAYTTSLNVVRKKKILKKDIDQATNIESNDNCLEALTVNDRNHYIKIALEKLGTKEKAVMTLYYLEELETKEVAKITGLSVSNVKVKVHRTRKKLYKILTDLLRDELNSIRV